MFPGNVKASITVSNILTERRRWLGVEAARRRYVNDDKYPDKLTVADKITERTKAIAVEPILPLRRVVETFAGGIHKNSEDRMGSKMIAEIVRILAHCQEHLGVAEVAG